MSKPTRKTRGSLYPSEREIEYYRRNFVEGANQIGRTGLLYQVDDELTKNIGTDSYYTHKKPVEVSYYLIENPRQKHLQKIGWNPEDKQSKPILCYLTFKDSEGHDIYPSEGAILEVSARQTPHDMQYVANKFDILAAKVDFEMNMFICNLVPHREYAKPQSELASSEDPVNENKWFKRDIVYTDEYRTKDDNSKS